jgi:hypothetical protein
VATAGRLLVEGAEAVATCPRMSFLGTSGHGLDDGLDDPRPGLVEDRDDLAAGRQFDEARGPGPLVPGGAS